MTNYQVLFYILAVSNAVVLLVAFNFRRLANDLLRALSDANRAFAQSTDSWSNLANGLIEDLNTALANRKGT